MSPTKRKLDDVENGHAVEPTPKKLILEQHGDGTRTRLGEMKYPRVDSKNAIQAPPFQYPFQLVSFSYTPERVLEFNNKALKYFVDPPIGADLTYRIDNWIRRAEERGRLDGLLKACLHDQVTPERRRATVVSWRGVMTKILTAPYETRDGWDLNVMLVNGTLYFEEHSNDEKLQEKEKSMTGKNRQQTYMGYAFESYCASSELDPSKDLSRLRNGWSGDVDTNVQWCSVVKTKLGDHRLLVGGEVDCVRGKYTGQPNNFVELKTSMAIRHQGDEVRFERKLLKFYFQSFLLGVPEIVVGFRTPAGRLTTLQSFKTIELPRLVRGKPHAWDPNLCLDWGHRFIQLIDSSVNKYNSNETDPHSLDLKSSRVWRARFKPNDGVEIYLLDNDGVEEVVNGEDRVGFLPKWYWDEVSTLQLNQTVNANASSSGEAPEDPRKLEHGPIRKNAWVI